MVSTKLRITFAVSLTNVFVNTTNSLPFLSKPFLWTQSWRSLTALT
jgi:hypothetical protein